ncbi:CRISPR/Cas system CSM-associated protein Csm3, group 7 of RAMP superfamily [Cohaesibacter sp. ES.047]|uniref:RAMP superfamily CRISPR-associated protein n=1 Tax=Cohaesibacter sp. ES.047 TaxID=1798205 RepID=UPI000BB905DF|nr:RAMP superfamily CRISPR-associated protein [Cohaesibacter sp. ES.047]SNY91606.1 CRISPR/Cas system CSM-associated protein Csm3, group 7 of RAMP superfamily [Cohaesibacter sp. ES.047]
MSGAMNMLLEYIRFSFELELASDCHIGDGKDKALAELRPLMENLSTDVDGGKLETRVATIVRAYDGSPCLPSTSLKGALRKQHELQMAKGELEGFFGAIKEGDEGAMGTFALYAGKLKGTDDSVAVGLPYWEMKEQTWIATHVAISRETGTAEHMKLFNQEMLPAGAVFEIEGVWFGTLDEARDGLAVLLAPFATRDGLSIGSGIKHGLGAFRFSKNKEQVLLKQTRFLPATGVVEEMVPKGTLTIQPQGKGQERINLKLFCDGPFLSVDPARRKGENTAKNCIKALKRNDKTPVLHIHSLVGALRARAAFLSECEGYGGDRRFRKSSEWTSPVELTSVERLFGVGGWRGLVRFSQPESAGAQEKGSLTSIAIDRFSGSVLDSTLFEHEVFVGVELDVSLLLEKRTSPDGVEYPTREDRKLFMLLLEGLQGDVLMLGHATNRGFGWFNVETTDLAAMKENG